MKQNKLILETLKSLTKPENVKDLCVRFVFCSFHFGNFFFSYSGHLLFVSFFKSMHFARQDGKDGKNGTLHKENHATKVTKKMTKIRKKQNYQNEMKKTFVTKKIEAGLYQTFPK